jgi:O-antigen ligase
MRVRADGLLVTVTLPLADVASLSPTRVDRFRRAIPGLLVGFAVCYLTMLFAQSTGGRGPWALTKAAVVVAAALVAVQPWRHLRARVLVLATAVSVAALLVCLVTTPGTFGGTRAAAYGLGAATFVTVAAYARSMRRVRLLAGLIVVAGGVQFAWSFVAWSGSGSASTQMVGTFYWHNQYGGFLLAPALLGLSMLLENRAPWRLVAWIVVPLAVAGVVYSSSRGAMLVLVGGWLLFGLMCLLSIRSTRKPLYRWVAASGLAVAFTFAIAGPPVFSHRASPLAPTQARVAAGETNEQSSSVRVKFWREAFEAFDHSPVTGVGYGAIVPGSVKYTPADWPRTPLAHNDYLQALAEGGLLLGIPFLLVCGSIAFHLVRTGSKRVFRRRLDVRTGVTVAALALMAHAAIDFDWSYPALFTLASALAALAMAPMLRRPSAPGTVFSGESASKRGDGRRLRAVIVGALALSVVAGGIVGRHGGLHLGYHPPAENATSTIEPVGTVGP